MKLSWRNLRMSNYDSTEDKLKAHYAELERKHRELDNELIERYNNQTIDVQSYLKLEYPYLG